MARTALVAEAASVAGPAWTKAARSVARRSGSPRTLTSRAPGHIMHLAANGCRRRRRRNTPRRFATRAPSQHYDVVIAGGGAVGSVLARLLLDDGFGARDGNSSYRRPLKVALLEQRSAPPSLADLLKGKKAPNPRAYALSPASLSYLGPSVLQSLVKHNRCGVYDAMQIWEHDGPAQLHFVGEDLEGAITEGRLVDLQRCLNGSAGEDAPRNNKRPWLGAVVEDAPLVASLWDELKGDDRIDLLDNMQIQSIRAPSPSDNMGHVEPPPPVELCFTRNNARKNGYPPVCSWAPTVPTLS